MINAAIVSGFLLSGIIQSIPVAISFSVNTALILWVWMLLRKQRKDQFSIRIVNHIALLIGVWVMFSVLFGLMMTFALLESASNPSLLNGFLYGFRIAMAWTLSGIIVLSLTLALSFKYIGSAINR